MKKWLLLTVLLVMLSTTAGCGEGPPADGSNAAVSGTITEESAASGEAEAASTPASKTMEASEVENDGAPLTDEEILTTYDRAVTAFSWFNLNPLPCNGETAAENGDVYYRVDYAGIGTLEDLKTYLRELFAEEIVQTLLPENTEMPLYRDVQGVLYELPFARGTDVHKGKITRTVEKISDTHYVVNVAVETLGEDLQTVTGIEYHAFPYEYINGRWVFTEFEMVN